MKDRLKMNFSESFLPEKHPKMPSRKTGVVLINLGTPDGYTYWPMRRYLKEFLSDRRVIEVNPILWQILLNVIILTTRPGKSGKAYKSIWNHEKGESPLLTTTRSQTEKLASLFEHREGVMVDFAMRYGNPSIESVLNKMAGQGVDRLVILPLYPQYCAATTATVCDKVFDVLKKMRWQPTLRVIPPYYEDQAYIDALAKSVTSHLKGLDWQPDLLLTSYHGIPQSYFKKGDPYHCQCAKTTRLLEETLKKKMGKKSPLFKRTFQSRFGPEEWLQPYTDKTLEHLPSEGVKNIAVLTPGFAADCLETLEEIAMEGKEEFLAAGGENFTFIPCLNDSDEAIKLYQKLIAENLF